MNRSKHQDVVCTVFQCTVNLPNCVSFSGQVEIGTTVAQQETELEAGKRHPAPLTEV